MKLIVATDKDWGIGKNNDLLVHLPNDLKFFKEKTIDKIVIMGRNTLESMPGGKPLPKRTNIVITGNPDYIKEGCVMAASVEEAVAKAKVLAGEEGEEKIFVIGGASIYEQMLPLCDTCFITRMNKAFEADRFFPNLDENPDFEVVWESPAQEENGVEYKFREYRRK